MKNTKLVEGHILTKNRNRYQYDIKKTYVAGISLKGTEVKSLIESGANIQSAFIVEHKGSLRVINMHISEWKNASINNHDPLRPRPLLLNKGEIRQIIAQINQKGFTAIPLKIFRKNSKFKIEVGVGKRLKLHDKRERIKKREISKSNKELNS